MVVWVLLSRVLIWSFCGSCPLFFSLQADFCLFQKGLDFFVWGGEVGLREFCCCLYQSVCSLFPAMPTCAGTHRSTTLLLFDRVHRLLCSCCVRKSVGLFMRDWRSRQGVREQNNTLLVAVFLSQVFCGSFQGVNFCSVVGAQVTSWDGEGGGGSIWATDVGTTASIPNSVLRRVICEDMGPGALGIAILHHLQCERFVQFWSLCSPCCKA